MSVSDYPGSESPIVQEWVEQINKTPRQPFDLYPTPPGAVFSLLDAMPELIFKAGGKWLEPMSGSGNIIKACNEWQDKHWPTTPMRPNWYCVDIRPEVEQDIRLLTPNFIAADFLKINFKPNHFDLCLTNPSFKIGQQAVEKALSCSKQVIMLLQINFMASKKRKEFHKRHPSNALVLSNRPGFIEGNQSTTDRADYAWYCWPGEGKWEPI